MNPWIDYKADFLTPERAKVIFDWISTQDLKAETGRCGEAPTHDSIQWGPRQAYIACVAPGVRIQSSGPIPSGNVFEQFFAICVPSDRVMYSRHCPNQTSLRWTNVPF